LGVFGLAIDPTLEHAAVVPNAVYIRLSHMSTQYSNKHGLIDVSMPSVLDV
jgi:hypothetical protein